MLGIPLGLLAANASEWLIHKHVLHRLGRKKGSFWSFHWHEHHAASRKNDHLDPAYHRPLHEWNPQSKEVLLLLGGAALVAPLLPIAPFFTGTVWYSAWNYYRVHKKAHLDPGWAREHLTWHYDHHMGPQPHANWCVTKPWFDELMGTRVRYAGTPREARDLARRAMRAHRKAAAKDKARQITGDELEQRAAAGA